MYLINTCLLPNGTYGTLRTWRVMSESASLQGFLQWCNASKIVLSDSVMITSVGSCAQYGMVAQRKIPKGKRLATIPRTAILSVSSKRMEELAHILVTDGLLPSSNSKASTERAAENSNVWIPLLVTLMSEYSNPDSHWRPYFDLCPDFDELDPLLLWESAEIERLLEGTGVAERLKDETERMERDYVDIVQPFVDKHKDLFKTSASSLIMYKKMVAFVMAYSFTDVACRNAFASVMMVPVADILNHHSRHNAKIIYGRTSLDIVAIRTIGANEEVFNTYGRLGNADLLYKYGFAEPIPNPNDYTTVKVEMLKHVAEMQSKISRGRFKKLWKFTCQLLDVDCSDNFVIDGDGKPETNLLAAVHVLCSHDKVVRKTSGITVPPTLDGLGYDAKCLMKDLCALCLKSYATSLEHDCELLKQEECRRRERFALYVRVGQKQLLQALVEACTVVN